VTTIPTIGKRQREKVARAAGRGDALFFLFFRFAVRCSLSLSSCSSHAPLPRTPFSFPFFPFPGFNVETVEYKNISFTVWDVGGQDKVRGRREGGAKRGARSLLSPRPLPKTLLSLPHPKPLSPFPHRSAPSGATTSRTRRA